MVSLVSEYVFRFSLTIKNMRLSFVKENNRWYINIPKWTGDHEDLEMVAGADQLCEQLSKDGKTLTIDINSSDTYDYIDPEEITLIKLSEDNGATYEVQDNTWTINADFEPTVDVEKIRISPVTKYVFGEYPKYIRINVTNRV